MAKEERTLESFGKHYCLQCVFLFKLENCAGIQDLILQGLVRLVFQTKGYEWECVFTNWLSETSGFCHHLHPTHLLCVARVILTN